MYIVLHIYGSDITIIGICCKKILHIVKEFKDVELLDFHNPKDSIFGDLDLQATLVQQLGLSTPSECSLHIFITVNVNDIIKIVENEISWLNPKSEKFIQELRKIFDEKLNKLVKCEEECVRKLMNFIHSEL